MSESELFPESTKFTYANTDGYQKDRIFDPYTYRHNYDEDQLEILLSKYVTETHHVEEIGVYLLDGVHSNKFLSKYEDGLGFCGARIRTFRTLHEIIYFNLRNYFNFEAEPENSMSGKMPGLLDGQNTHGLMSPKHRDRNLTDVERCFGNKQFALDRIEILTQEFQFLDLTVLTSFYKGSKLINVSATTTVLKGLDELFFKIDEAFATLQKKDTRENNKIVFSLIMKLSGCFDFLYSAMICDPESIYFSIEEDSFLEDALEFVDVEDPEEYWRLADEGYFEIGKIIGVASRTFKHKSKVRQFISFIGWMPFYFLFNRKKGSAQGFFFMNVLNKNVFRRMNAVYEMSTYKKVLKLASPKIEMEVKIYITIPEQDCLTVKKNLINK